MNTFSHVPPGFRFHPTDEELVDYYLRKKIAAKRIDLDVIKDVDLYKIEPWDLQELCKISNDEQNEWYFFSHKDKKYPTGTRTNRATKAGFWKATGRDKAIYSKHSLIGMRKTLVFYKGRAPNGLKSDWIMHEYRLETNENGTPQEEGWVVCRVFKKRLAAIRKDGEHEQMCWYEDQVSFMPDFDSPRRISQSPYASYNNNNNNLQYCKQEQLQYNNMPHHHHHHHTHDAFLQLPQLESPKIPHSSTPNFVPMANILQSTSNILTQDHQPHHLQQQMNSLFDNNNINDHHQGGIINDQVTDWRVLDKFVASQLSHDQDLGTGTGTGKEPSIEHHQVNNEEQLNIFINESKRQEEDEEEESNPSSQIDLWK